MPHRSRKVHKEFTGRRRSLIKKEGRRRKHLYKYLWNGGATSRPTAGIGSGGGKQ